MSNDRELLELAAKAAGIKSPKVQDMRGWGEVRYGFSEAIFDDDREEYWNPLVDGGDAMRLAVKLRFTIEQWTHSVVIKIGDEVIRTELADGSTSRLELTRRAIVRAAAEIGRPMP